MRIDVKLIIAGKIFTETVLARDYDHAKQIALARNPGATVVSITANFRDPNKASSFDLDSLIDKNKKVQVMNTKIYQVEVVIKWNYKVL